LIEYLRGKTCELYLGPDTLSGLMKESRANQWDVVLFSWGMILSVVRPREVGVVLDWPEP
jgi:hypothetical protein